MVLVGVHTLNMQPMQRKVFFLLTIKNSELTCTCNEKNDLGKICVILVLGDACKYTTNLIKITSWFTIHLMESASIYIYF